MDPTPSEIAAACEELQAGWTAYQRHRRLCWPDHQPQYHLLAVILGVDRDRARRVFSPKPTAAELSYRVPTARRRRR